MNALHTLARLMLRACVALAPKHRADWTRAMQAEFEAVEAGGPALEWALGCLATAAGWRLRADGGYLLAFLAAIATSVWFDNHWQEYVRPGVNWNLSAWDNTMVILGMALPVCVIAAVVRRPRPAAVWLLAIAAAIALFAWDQGQWREVMQSSTTRLLPPWAAAMLVLNLALPGSITAAICWRLRDDTIYVTALVGLIAAAWWLDGVRWDQFPHPTTDQFFSLAAASPYIRLALPCLLLCVYRPDRALLTLFVTLLLNAWLAGQIAAFPLSLLADPFKAAGNHPNVPNVIMALLFSWSMFGAAVIGAATGWTLGTLGRRLRPA